MSRKSISILSAVVVLIVTGIFTAAAQDTTTTTTTCPMMQGGHGMMGMMGMGMMGNGMMSADEDTMMAAAAKALNLEPASLIDKLHSGQTLAQIAEAQGVKVQDVYDAMFALAKDHMAAAVKADTMTQAQADAHLKAMQDNITNMPMLGNGTGGCMDMSGHGMMGHGHGMMGDMNGGMMRRGHGMMDNNS